MKRSPADTEVGARPAVLVGVVVGLGAVICLMLLAFSAPPMHSGPHEVPLAVSGPGPEVSRLQDALDEKSPHAFQVTAYAHDDEVTAAIGDRDAVGGISFTPAGVTVKTASAAGVPYATVLHTVGDELAADGMAVTYTDVVPLTGDDPTGAGIAALALPLALGGTVSAALLTTLLPHRRALRVAGSAVFAALTGLAVTAILQQWLGAVAGNYWGTAAGVGLGIVAISLTVLGLESLLGYAGIAVGALTMVFVANPLSALATGPAWLPQPWGDIGQLLPIGAAGTVIRSAAFFDGAGSEQALLVLGSWIALGLALLSVPSPSRLRQDHKAGRVQGAPAEPQAPRTPRTTPESSSPAL